MLANSKLRKRRCRNKKVMMSYVKLVHKLLLRLLLLKRFQTTRRSDVAKSKRKRKKIVKGVYNDDGKVLFFTSRLSGLKHSRDKQQQPGKTKYKMKQNTPRDRWRPSC